jgi:hypoxanthine phosphoribosyltransferase
VAVIDEIADAGQTLALVKEAVLSKGAARVITAAMFSHSWANPKPDFVAQITDELVIFPWDRRVRLGGQWQIHPEIAQALALQGLKGDEV